MNSGHSTRGETKKRHRLRFSHWLIGLLGASILVALASDALESWFYREGQGNLERLYAVARQMKPGMPYDDVRILVRRAEGGGVFAVAPDDRSFLALHARLSLLDACSLHVAFQDGRLVSTDIIGEDGPHDLCPGAPAGINPGR